MLTQCYQACAADNIKLISVDMFDTLVFRQVGDPRALFGSLAKRGHEKGWITDDAEAFIELRCTAEAKARSLARQNSDISEVLLNDIYDQIPYFDTHSWSQLEIDAETNCWRVNEELVEILLRLQHSGKKLVLLSDMYLPEEAIKAFWQKIKPNINWDEIRVSGERKKSKADGSAYKSLVETSELPADRIIHIGDNLVADVQMAQAAGLNVFHLKQPDYLTEINKLEQVICPLQVPGLQRLRQTVALREYKYQEVNYPALGAFIYGPVLVAFARWIIQTCRKKGIQRLYCLLREGAIISEILQVFEPDLEIRTIAISRRSSFLPRLKDLNQDTLFKLTERRGYCLAEMASDIGQELPKSLLDYKNEYLSELVKQECWKIIVHWINGKHDEISIYLKEQQVLLIRYLIEQGVANTSSQAILDWGCGGSMLITVSELLGLKKNQYFMFYRKPSAQELTLKGALHCFQPLSLNKRASALAASPEVSEILLNQSLRSTVTYSNIDTFVKPVKEDILEINTRALRAFKIGVLECAEIAKQQRWLSDEVDTPSRKRIFSILYRLIEYPLFSEAKLISGLKVPVSSHKSAPLLAEDDWKKLTRHSAEQCWSDYLRSIDGDVKKSWWFTGMMALAFPGFLQQQGDFFRQFDDDLVAAILLEKIRKIGVNRVVVYGAGELGYKLYSLLKVNGIEITSFIDRRAEQHQFTLAGLPVYSLDRVDIPPQTLLVVASRAFSEEIYNILAKRFPNHINNIIRIK